MVSFRVDSLTTYRAILVSLWGCLIFSIANILENFTDKKDVASALLNIGWIAMTTGFSFVLYSRLHLLHPDPRLLKAILILIIVNVFLFHIPVFVVTTLGNEHPTLAIYHVYHILSQTEVAFTVQELIITTTYIYLFVQFTKDLRQEPKTTMTLGLLLGSEVIVLAADVTLNVLLFTKIYLARQMTQAFIAALKRRIEFVVLNSLVDYSQIKSRRAETLSWPSRAETFITFPGQNVVLPSRKPSDHSSPDDIEAGPSQDKTWTSFSAQSRAGLGIEIVD
jgi:hypothetical protein